MLSRVSPGKDHLHLSHTLLSTYHSLSGPNIPVCLPLPSPLSSRQAGGPVPISSRGLPEGLMNILELDGAVTEHSGRHRGLPPHTWPHRGQASRCLARGAAARVPSALKRGLTRVRRDSGPWATTLWVVPELLRGVKMRTRWAYGVEHVLLTGRPGIQCASVPIK